MSLNFKDTKVRTSHLLILLRELGVKNVTNKADIFKVAKGGLKITGNMFVTKL